MSSTHAGHAACMADVRVGSRGLARLVHLSWCDNLTMHCPAVEAATNVTLQDFTACEANGRISGGEFDAQLIATRNIRFVADGVRLPHCCTVNTEGDKALQQDTRRMYEGAPHGGA